MYPADRRGNHQMSRLLHAAVFGAATAGALTLGTGVAHADGTHHDKQLRHGGADHDSPRDDDTWWAQQEADMDADFAADWGDDAYDSPQAAAAAKMASAARSAK